MIPPVATSLLPAPDEAAQAAASNAPVPQLVDGFSIEATPKQLRAAGCLADLLPVGTNVYVPYLPRAAMSDTVFACRRLAGQGLRPVPHLTARALVSRAQLEEHLARLAEAGADSLLLIAGDRRRPAGPFQCTLEVLDTGLLQRHGFVRLGVAGHPEGHPVADEQTLIDALHGKSVYAEETGSTMWIVTQFAFSPAPVVQWVDRMRTAGIDLPVRIGMPGPAKAQTLVRYALQCGVGASSRMLTRRSGAVTRLFSGWTPARMLPPLARHATRSPAAAIAGVHVFPFGGLLKSIEFFTRLQSTDG